MASILPVVYALKIDALGMRNVWHSIPKAAVWEITVEVLKRPKSVVRLNEV